MAGPAATVAPLGPYPADWEAGVALADGTAAWLRPIRAADADALVRFHESLSPATVRSRFFNAHPHLSSTEVSHFTVLDYHDRVALVVLQEDRFLAVGRYDRVDGSTTAEVAFVVADDYQSLGLGTLLFHHVALAARARGIDRLVAETFGDNRRMLAVFRHSGYPVECHFVDGLMQVSMRIAA